METKIILAVGLLVAITVLYKLLPYRNLGTKKPIFALLPKYKTTIKRSLTDAQIISIMSGV
jgi:hypothetical protein